MTTVLSVSGVNFRTVGAYAIVSAFVIAATQIMWVVTPSPSLDALRYVDYAFNLAEYNVFGLSAGTSAAAPGYANSPLYPWFVSLVARLDPAVRETFHCLLLAQADAARCDIDLGALVAAQSALVWLMLFCVWWSAIALIGRVYCGWLAAALAFATTKPTFFANHILTEILMLALVALLMVAIIAAVRSGKARWWMFCGAVLGALALTRPEYRYIFYSFAALALIACIARYRVINARKLAMFIVGFHLLVLPWQLRNYHHFSELTITGGYADVILAQRTALNYMTPKEWGYSFVYWLPGYGEPLAAAMFPDGDYQRLGMGPNSYVIRGGKAIFDDGLAAVGGERDKLTGYLMRTEVVGRAGPHLAVSLPLLWRGVLAGKYLAAIGILCLAWMVVSALRRRSDEFLALMLVPLSLAPFYALFSASVPRYNVYLIFYFAIAVAWAIERVREVHQGG